MPERIFHWADDRVELLHGVGLGVIRPTQPGLAVSKDWPNLPVWHLPASAEAFTCSGWLRPRAPAYDFAAGLIGGTSGAKPGDLVTRI